MSILWRLIFFNRCTSTHHKLALDALRFLRGPQCDLWANLFLSNHEQYLAGSKAPDNEFKDFKNHVLHVADNFWGGATGSARQWYQKTVVALSQGDWPLAAYNAGVLSHYFTDPFQPFHTGQTEAEGKVHRAAEWSICKAYEELQANLEHDLEGYPEDELSERPDWLEEAIRQGALKAHESYDICIDHYDLNRGIKDPPSGLDQEMRDRLARLIGLAAVGFSRVLERAFDESQATPPDVAISLQVLLATLKVPLNWIRKKFVDLHERAVIEAIYLEIQDQGKVTEALPEDERTVRKLYAQEVLKVPVRQLDAEPVRATGTQYGTGTPARGAAATAVISTSTLRTTVPRPHFGSPQSPSAPLETCLMVPLAKEVPQDFVADSVVRAYLQQVEQQSTGTTRPPAAGHLSGLNIPAILERSVSPTAPADVIPMVSQPPVSAVQPALSPTPVPTKRELDREERRLQKRERLNRLRDPEPVLTAPSLPLPPALISSLPAADADLPFDMFGPLPAPRITRTEPGAASTTVDRVLATASVPAPQPTVPGLEKPPDAGSKLAAVASAPVTATVSRGTTSGPTIARANPVPTRSEKTFAVQAAASQVVPTPHIRLPEPAAEAISSIEQTNRLTSLGTLEGADLRSVPEAPRAATPSPLPPAPLPAPAPAVARQTAPAIPVVPIVKNDVAKAAPATSVSDECGLRFYLDPDAPIVDAPSIGPKTAERLHTIQILTVADLLAVDPAQAAVRLGNPAATSVIRDWQDQARLVCTVPELRGHDAQFLVACQIRTARQLQQCEPLPLQQQILNFLATSAGQRLLRDGTQPDLKEVTEWIQSAKHARTCPNC